MEDLGVGGVELLLLSGGGGDFGGGGVVGKMEKKGSETLFLFLLVKKERRKRKKKNSQLTLSVIESIIVMNDLIRSCVALSWPWSSMPDWAIPGSIPRSWVICFRFFDFFPAKRELSFRSRRIKNKTRAPTKKRKI